jgi:glycosyltransferase involved in cell wall biosynthesis
MSLGSPTFTIFIPTYNRAKLLPRALASIEAQTYRDFEVLIVDDGSSDGTQSLIAQWTQCMPFPVTYLRQANQGKHAAHNVGVAAARGELFVLLDSDDRLLPTSLERMLKHWLSIPEQERERFAGVEGLIQSMDGQLLPQMFPQSPMDASFLEIRQKRGVGGDKKHALRTDILRCYPYPVFPGERHVRPSLTWKRFAHHYLFRCVNEPFQEIEYQPDGLSADRFALRMHNPRGFQLACLEDITLHRSWLKEREVRRRTIDYIEFSLRIGLGLAAQAKQTKWDHLWLVSIPVGVGRWLLQQYRLKFKGGSK